MLSQKSNPLTHKTRQSEALEAAFEMMIDTFEEYAQQKELTESEIRHFTKLLMEAYLEKKAGSFLAERLDIMNRNLNYLLENVGEEGNTNPMPLSIFYFNQKSYLK